MRERLAFLQKRIDAKNQARVDKKAQEDKDQDERNKEFFEKKKAK